jgi:DHA1 family multidrug resistance protein-like MFS transporter
MRGEMLLIYLIAFLASLDMLGLAPLMAPYARAVGAPIHLVGWIVAFYSVANLAGNLSGGWWADRAGRKLPLIVGLVTMATALFAYPLLREPLAILVVRALHGLGNALVTPAALAYLGDASSSTSRGRTMALYGVTYGMAGLIGPPLAGWLRDRVGYGGVFVGLSALMLAAVLVAMAKIRNRGVSAPERPASQIPWRSLLGVGISVSFFAAFCWMFTMGTLLVFLPLIGEERGFTAAQVGLIFGSFALTAALVQASPLGRLSDRWGRLPLIAAGLFLMATAMVALSASRSWEEMIGAMAFYGLGFGLLFPAALALLVDQTTSKTRGQVFGIFMAMLSVGTIAGSGMAGWMDQWHQTAGIHPFQLVALVLSIGLLWTGISVLITRQARRALPNWR